MNVFAQGMRRSGTTVLFDALWEDGQFDCYYEPLARARRPAVGGGSGLRKLDYFEKIRALRAEFLAAHPQVGDPDLLHYGAPGRPELEFERALPDPVRDYLAALLARSEDTFVKFTRMYCKVPVLKELDPAARLIVIVRDPRAVVASYLFGKDQKHRARFPDVDAFFTRRSRDTAWSSYAFSEYLLGTPEFSHLRRCEDHLRVLLIWKYTFRETWRDARRCFGESVLLFRHEDLVADPRAALHRLYGFLDRPLPDGVLDWVVKRVRPPQEPFAASDPRWSEAFRRLDMAQELEQAGYDAGPSPRGTLRRRLAAGLRRLKGR